MDYKCTLYDIGSWANAFRETGNNNVPLQTFTFYAAKAFRNNNAYVFI